MFCPRCRSEYRDGITQCTDCGIELQETLEPDEQPTDDTVLAPLTESHDSWLVEAVVARLEKAGVPYVITAGTGLALLDQPGVEFAEPLPWEARILVHAPMIPRARRILEQVTALEP